MGVRGPLWFPPLGSETRCLYVLPSAPLLISPSGCGGEIRNGADGSARRADAGREGGGQKLGAHSGGTPCRGPVRELCGGCAALRGRVCTIVAAGWPVCGRLSGEGVEEFALALCAEAGMAGAVQALFAFPGEGVGEQFCARAVPEAFGGGRLAPSRRAPLPTRGR